MLSPHAHQVRDQAACLRPLLLHLATIEEATAAIEALPADADRATLRAHFAALHAAYDDAIGILYHRPTMTRIRDTASTMYQQHTAYAKA
jgi:hypothetical protein